MPSYRVNVNGMVDTADELTLITNEIAESVNMLDLKVQDFLANNEQNFTEELQNAQVKWGQGIQHMNNAMADARGRLDAIRTNYEETDISNASRLAGI